jgi:hypothetical protein
MRFIGVFASSILKKITDTFTRANTTTGLGSTTSGAVWSATRGNWFVNTNQAKSVDAASTYPVATVDAGTVNPTVLLDVDTNNGVGIAFWVSDNQNWWGVHPWQDTNYSSSCAAYSQVCTSASYYSVCTSSSYGSTCTSPFSGYSTSCSSYGYFASCNGYGYGRNYGSGGAYYVACTAGYSQQFTCTAYTSVAYSGCSAYGQTYSCDAYGQSGTCTGYGSSCNTYSQTSSAGTTYLRLVKSVTNVVTTVVDQAVTAAIASLKLVISNGVITAKAYSSTGQVTQTGTDLVNTPTTPTTATKHGLVLAPGGYTQGAIADNLTISM